MQQTKITEGSQRLSNMAARRKKSASDIGFRWQMSVRGENSSDGNGKIPICFLREQTERKF
jgi:hypothetical protein